MSRVPSSLGQQINSSLLVVLVAVLHTARERDYVSSEFPIYFSTRLTEFYRFFLHAALQRLGFRDAELRGVVE